MTQIKHNIVKSILKNRLAQLIRRKNRFFLFIRGFLQKVHGVWRNKELTPKGEHVKLITRWKHVPYTVGQYFFTFEFLDESFKISQIKYIKNSTPFYKFCINFQIIAKFSENFQNIQLKFSQIFSKLCKTFSNSHANFFLISFKLYVST